MNKTIAEQKLSDLFLACRTGGWKEDYFPALDQIPMDCVPLLVDRLTDRGMEPSAVTDARAAIAAATVNIVTANAAPHRFAEAVAEKIGAVLFASVEASRRVMEAQFEKKTARIRKRADLAAADAEIQAASNALSQRLEKLERQGGHERLVFLLPSDIAVHHFRQNLIREDWSCSGFLRNRFRTYWDFDLGNTAEIAIEPLAKRADIVAFPYSPDLWQLANCVRQLQPGSTVFVNLAVPPVAGTFPRYSNQGKPGLEFSGVISALAGLPAIHAGKCVEEPITALDSQLLPYAGRIVCGTEALAAEIARKIRYRIRGEAFGFKEGDPVLLVRKDRSILHHLFAGEQGTFVSTVGEVSRVRFGKTTRSLPLRKCKIVHAVALFREWVVGQKPGKLEWAVVENPALASDLTMLGFNVRLFRP